MTLIELISWEGLFPPSDDTEIKDTHPTTHTQYVETCYYSVVYAPVTKFTHSVFSARQISVYSTLRGAFMMKLLLWSAYEQKAQGWRGSPAPTSLISCQFKSVCPLPALWLNFFHLLTVCIEHSCISLQLAFFWAKQEMLLFFFHLFLWEIL